MTKTKRRVLKVLVHREIDVNPDLSYLGEYSNHDDGNGIDRAARGDYEHGTYRWFNPAMTGEETGNPDSPEEDYQRMEAYNRGDWCMCGVYTTAQIVLSDVVQTIRSGGLWGIESDSGDDYFAEEEANQLADLRRELELIGFTHKQLDKAFANVERREF